ncbi:MAG: hypothetical protein CMQ19_06910 [Gammaproteobacteria bacterium]|nr:hypothetical protein [Gammaproteobacteria bacterium]
MITRTQLILFALLLVSCGDHGPSISDNQQSDFSPALEVHFPPPNAHFSGASIDVQGRYLDAGNDLAKIEIGAGGRPVTATLDPVTQTWRAVDIPIIPMGVSIPITAFLTSSSSGEITKKQVGLLDSNAFLVRATGIAFDQLKSRALVTDFRLGALVSVDIANGDRTLVTKQPTEGGQSFQSLTAIKLDPTSNNLYLLDPSLSALIEINLFTGQSNTLSSPEIGTGPVLSNPRGFDIDLLSSQALVTDSKINGLFSVSLDDGGRSIIFDKTSPDGSLLPSPQGVAIDRNRNKALIADNQRHALLELDLTTFELNVISDIDTGSGASLISPRDVHLDALNNRVILLDTAQAAIMAIDLATGDRQVLSHQSVGVGPGFKSPAAMSVDLLGQQAFIADNGLSALLQVDLEKGARQFSSRVAVGSGDRVDSPFGIFIDPVQLHLLVADHGLDAIISIDSQTGDRSIISDENTGSGSSLFDPVRMTYGSTNKYIYLVYTQFDLSGVMRVDPTTGERTVIADGSTGTGQFIFTPLDIEFDTNSKGLIVLDAHTRRLLEINPVSLQRTILSDDSHGLGDPLVRPLAFEFDHLNNLIYVLDIFQNAIIIIDKSTGDRSPMPPHQGESPRLFEAIDMAMDRDRNQLLLTMSNPPRLVALSLSDGKLKMVSGAGKGEGPQFDSLSGIDIDPTRNIATVVDQGLDSVFVVDLESGDRVILSK